MDSSSSSYAKIAISKEMVERSTQRAKALGKLKGSVMEGASNLIGYLGEELVLSRIKEATMEDTFHYDLKLGSITLDVKSYRCISEPRPHYGCTIWGFNPHQLTDFYVFTRVHESLEWGWIVGVVSKRDFFMKAKKHEKGTIEVGQQKDGKAFAYRSECFILPMSELKPLEKLLIYHWI